MSPRRKAVGDTLVEGDKCSVMLYLLSSPAASLCARHTAARRPGGLLESTSSDTPENKRGMRVLLYRTLAYTQEIPSDMYRKCGDAAPPSPRCFFFLLLVTQFSLDAFTLSIGTDRPVCRLQITIIA